MTSRKLRILWGISGSVAAIRSNRLAQELVRFGEVQAVVTRRAKHFLDTLPDTVAIHDDDSEWSHWRQLGDPVLHIELRRWADVFVIAPLTADAMAKIANGVCDSLLLSVVRAWDFSKPVLIAPAMNTQMWDHPITEEHLARVQAWGMKVIPPVSKELACADVGMGALAAPETIVKAMKEVAVPLDEPADQTGLS